VAERGAVHENVRGGDDDDTSAGSRPPTRNVHREAGTVIHEETIQKLVDLKLDAMAAAARELATSSPNQQLTAPEILGLFVDREHVHRDNRRLARRLKEARPPANAASVEERSTAFA